MRNRRGVSPLKQTMKDADPEKVAAFMRLARRGLDLRDLLMVEALVEGGTTLWQAARQAAKITNESEHTLFFRGRSLLEEIYQHLGRSAHDWAAELVQEGEVVGVPRELVPKIRQIVRANGHDIEESTMLRLETPTEPAYTDRPSEGDK